MTSARSSRGWRSVTWARTPLEMTPTLTGMRDCGSGKELYMRAAGGGGSTPGAAGTTLVSAECSHGVALGWGGVVWGVGGRGSTPGGCRDYPHKYRHS